jgi:hypothetical protein
MGVVSMSLAVADAGLLKTLIPNRFVRPALRLRIG